MTKNIKLAYIGGGSKMWARVFMADLALTPELCGEIALYDIDLPAAQRNRAIGERINRLPQTLSKWHYTVCENLRDALDGADFVVCSILPGTFDEMAVDVHAPEKYGIFQSVGDTSGPGGVLRAMRTVPIYEGFASAIAETCPDAWVINFTNPMTLCTKTLFDVFPQVKAFGCCHEVFHAQEFLACVAAEELGCTRPDRHEISVDASGLNHFTWITKANFRGIDLLKLLPHFAEKYYESGYCEQTDDPQAFKDNPFLYGNKVKMDLFRRYGVLGAAGDRHLAEFMNANWYLKNPEQVHKWLFNLTSVDFRKRDQAEKIAQSIAMAEGSMPVEIRRSDEEAVNIMLALAGGQRLVSNVNTKNIGQMPDMPLGSVVETNCVFACDSVTPLVASPLPSAVKNMVYRNLVNTETCYYGIKHRDFDEIFAAFVDQPLCANLSVDEAYALFVEMVRGTETYLKDYFDMKKIDK